MENSHILKDEELDYLISSRSIRIDKSEIDAICEECCNEPICHYGLSCQFVRKPIIARLKKLSSQELTELVFRDEQ